MALLRVEELAKTFFIHHLERRIPVFEKVSFELVEGSFLRVIGRNGGGKSTLLRCLYRTYRSSGGQALYQSLGGAVDLAQASDIDIALLRQREFGFVTQFLRPRPRVSARDLVAEPLIRQGVEGQSARSQAEDLLHRFGLNRDLWQAYPATFSGGEQQRVNLAQGLCVPRRLLLLDEPTASLDKSARAAIAERLAELKAHGVTMIGIFHHTEDLETLVDDTLDIEPYGS